MPENLDEIRALSDLSKDLVDDFIEKNKSKEKLGNGYDVKISYDVAVQNNSLESLFKIKKKKQPRLKAIIGLSKVGFNFDKTQSLVYVEYFNLEKQLLKKYCLISWKREGNSLRDEDIKWF